MTRNRAFAVGFGGAAFLFTLNFLDPSASPIQGLTAAILILGLAGLVLYAFVSILFSIEGAMGTTDDVVERMAEAYADAWAADIKQYLQEDVPTWSEMGDGQKAAMRRVAAAVYDKLKLRA